MPQSPFSINISKGTNANIVEITGSLVINHIEKLYHDLSTNLDFSKNLKVVLDQVENIDITFVQLLLSLKKQFGKTGLELTLQSNLSDDMWLLLNNAGFNKQLIN
jgi:anti-anti-sigma regulatory factor